MSKPKILFLCTGNSARSQMAEAFLRKYGGDRFEAYSAGVKPRGLNPLTVKVMNEVGIDVSKQVSKGPEAYLGTTLFKEIITVCEDAEENAPTAWVSMEIRRHWPFEDPSMFEGTDEEKLAKFREVRDLIEKRIKEWLAEQNTAEQNNSDQ
jgi:arsenate reductase (thioredoxin)